MNFLKSPCNSSPIATQYSTTQHLVYFWFFCYYIHLCNELIICLSLSIIIPAHHLFEIKTEIFYRNGQFSFQNAFPTFHTPLCKCMYVCPSLPSCQTVQYQHLPIRCGAITGLYYSCLIIALIHW